MIGLPQLDQLPALASLPPDGWRHHLRAWLHSLPDGWRLPVADYVLYGDEPPPALKAAIENDLARAIVPLADEDVPRLRNLIAILTWNCPAECWGSGVAVADWIGRGGVFGPAPASAAAAAPAERRAA